MLSAESMIFWGFVLAVLGAVGSWGICLVGCTTFLCSSRPAKMLFSPDTIVTPF